MSLLPSLQEVPEERKLRVRMKLMDVLLQEQEDLFTAKLVPHPNTSSISWDITLCSPLKANRCFGGNVSSIFRVEKAKQETSTKSGASKTLGCYLLTDFLLLLLFNPEDGGDMFLRHAR
jgi:hypothetical protein